MSSDSPSAGLPPYAQALGHGVHAIDTGFERDRFDAAYLVVADDRAAFIDSGTSFSVPRLLGTLAALGLDTSAVDWVIPTHVHLDHAGGAGLLMSHLPRARMLVHPRGVRHMVDPSALWQGAAAVYGAEVVARSYGTLVAVPAERVVASADGMTIEFGGRTLMVADTPGHARHHHCLWDEASRGWFTGDTFGISYREFDTARGAWIMPSATPVQFEPDVLQASVTRLLESNPDCMYLTHFGRVDEVARLGEQFFGMLAGMVALGRAQQPSAGRHAALVQGQLELFGRSLAEHGCTHSRDELAQLLAVDLELNAQGMALWLDRR